MNVQPMNAANAAAPPPPSSRLAVEELSLNEPRLVIHGGTVRLSALLDLDGVAALEKRLAALKVLLEAGWGGAAPATDPSNKRAEDTDAET